jgi:hypothetical protein
MGDKTEDHTVSTRDGFWLQGTVGKGGWVAIREMRDGVQVVTLDRAEVVTSVNETRELARRLYVLAARVEKRLNRTAQTGVKHG